MTNATDTITSLIPIGIASGIAVQTTKHLNTQRAKRAKPQKVKTITAKQWRNTPKDYKSVIDGQRMILTLTKKGTSLVPVKVKGMRQLKKVM